MSLYVNFFICKLEIIVSCMHTCMDLRTHLCHAQQPSSFNLNDSCIPINTVSYNTVTLICTFAYITICLEYFPLSLSPFLLCKHLCVFHTQFTCSLFCHTLFKFPRQPYSPQLAFSQDFLYMSLLLYLICFSYLTEIYRRPGTTNYLYLYHLKTTLEQNGI